MFASKSTLGDALMANAYFLYKFSMAHVFAGHIHRSHVFLAKLHQRQKGPWNNIKMMPNCISEFTVM